MKKIIAFLLALALCLSFVSCGGGGQPEPESTPEPTPIPTPIPTPTPKPIERYSLGDRIVVSSDNYGGEWALTIEDVAVVTEEDGDKLLKIETLFENISCGKWDFTDEDFAIFELSMWEIVDNDYRVLSNAYSFEYNTSLVGPTTLPIGRKMRVISTYEFKNDKKYIEIYGGKDMYDNETAYIVEIDFN